MWSASVIAYGRGGAHHPATPLNERVWARSSTWSGEVRTQDLRGRERAGDAERDAGQRESEAGADDEAEHSGPAGAQRHPDADLPGAAGHGVRGDAVHARGR